MLITIPVTGFTALFVESGCRAPSSVHCAKRWLVLPTMTDGVATTVAPVAPANHHVEVFTEPATEPLCVRTYWGAHCQLSSELFVIVNVIPVATPDAGTLPDPTHPVNA
ncbi:MAG: hypothetical protein BWY59_00144 [Verrucomicrobia bacterium ADurb.Bin345]|nr:MAG: hypothetical protein BWY59_00144 [Verrucomicrobia bacterium ADurb.Bin345]